MWRFRGAFNPSRSQLEEGREDRSCRESTIHALLSLREDGMFRAYKSFNLLKIHSSPAYVAHSLRRTLYIITIS